MIEELISRIAKGREACFADNVEPRDVLVSRGIQRKLFLEADKYMAYMTCSEWTKIMGLKVEWVNTPIHEVSIRTYSGDVRRLP